MIPDQVPIWNQKHSDGDHENLRQTPSPLSVLVEPRFPRHAELLELGCGVGRDAVFFAQKGHRVTATDASDVAIEQDKRLSAHSGVNYAVIDMREALPYDSNSFDVVYANLSLHYYSDKQTRKIVAEIARVLKVRGVLAFACKSPENTQFHDGQEVEKDVFVAKSGHARHLFSEAYAKELMADAFEVIYLDEILEEYNGFESNIVRCVASKAATNDKS